MANNVNSISIPLRQCNVSQYKIGDDVDNTFSVKYTKEPRPTKNGNLWFDIRLADKTGEISLKFWGNDDKKTQTIYESLKQAKVVYTKGGKIADFNGPYISVNSDSGIVEPTTDYNPGDFVAQSKQSIPDMISELDERIEGMDDPFLKPLLKNFFDNPKNLELFSTCPAAMSYHQNYIGGLLEHSLQLVQACWFYSMHHDELDTDLLIAGCILHDIGKIKELQVDVGIEVSEEGNFLGHVTSGVILVNDMIREIPDFPEILRLKLLHIIISHHGKKEHGALKEPSFPEAELIHQVDMMDSQVSYMEQQIEQSNTDDDWLWDGKTKRRIFRH